LLLLRLPLQRRLLLVHRAPSLAPRRRPVFPWHHLLPLPLAML
jgi:hypothetical protein